VCGLAIAVTLRRWPHALTLCILCAPQADEATSLALSPLIILHLLRRRAQGLERNVGERIGLGVPRKVDALASGQRVWIHGSSVGESVSALTLARLLAERNPGLEFVITSGTVDGVDVIRKRLGCAGSDPSAAACAVGLHGASIFQCVQAPSDLPFAVWSFRRRWQPSALVVIEADLWPSMLSQCARSGIPLALVDGRMSERSVRRWNFWLARPLVRFLLTRFSVVLCQSALDATRLRALGASTAESIGSIKGAAGPLPVNAEAVRAVEEALRGGRANRHEGRRRMWLAASTHEVEEEIAARAHEAVVQVASLWRDRDHEVGGLDGGSTLRPLLVIIPRHPRRCAQVVKSLVQTHPHWEIVMRSEMRDVSCLATADLLVVDELGVLGEWYSAAEVALVGGSMVDGIGGHNVMEPALLGCVPLHGPFAFNGQHLIDALRDEDPRSIRQVTSSEELATAVVDVLLSARQEGVAKDGPLQSATRAAAQRVRQKSCARIVDAVHEAIKVHSN
jgi:3-deoxy-D-manno-octulosonic-acid transferase